MENMKRTIFVILIIYLSGCAISNVRQHPQITTELRSIDTVVIAPPAVNIEQHNFDGETEKLKELEQTIRNNLISIANNKLSEKGFKVVDFDFNQAINDDEEFAYIINQVREGYKQARKALYHDDEDSVDEEEGGSLNVYRATVGTAINSIAEKTGADSLLLINYSGAKKSGGNVAKDIAMGVIIGLLTGVVPVSSTEASIIEVALIDNSTGNVLWTNLGNSPQLNANIADTVMYKMPMDVD